MLRKVDTWIDEPLTDAATERERRAGLVLALDDAVGEAVDRLKEKGLTSPYLKSVRGRARQSVPLHQG